MTLKQASTLVGLSARSHLARVLLATRWASRPRRVQRLPIELAPRSGESSKPSRREVQAVGLPSCNGFSLFILESSHCAQPFFKQKGVLISVEHTNFVVKTQSKNGLSHAPRSFAGRECTQDCITTVLI
jgi:hypothetical protein